MSKKSKKNYEVYLNELVTDSDDEKWIIGGKNRYCHRMNYGTMLKRYDRTAFEVGYKEWSEQSTLMNQGSVRGLSGVTTAVHG